MLDLKRRGFIALLGGAAVAWPLAARAQQPERIRRIIVLMGIANDAEAQARAVALRQALQVLGWTIGRNIQIDYSFADGDTERMRVYAKEVVASGPDLILAVTNPALQAVRNATRRQPIVFLQVSDPVGGGFVESLAHPGGNITGFTNFEPEMGGKWLQTLKEIAPAVEHVAVVMHSETSAHAGFLRTAEIASVALGIKVTSLGVHNANEIEPAITQFALVPKGGLIVAPHPLTRGKLTSTWPRAIACLRSIHLPFMPKRADSLPMGSTKSISGEARPPTSIAFFVVQNLRTCRYSSRRNTSW
jgi:putative ABC transport system substrate-binding protein